MFLPAIIWCSVIRHSGHRKRFEKFVKRNNPEQLFQSWNILLETYKAHPEFPTQMYDALFKYCGFIPQGEFAMKFDKDERFVGIVEIPTTNSSAKIRFIKGRTPYGGYSSIYSTLNTSFDGVKISRLPKLKPLKVESS
jgi:hypothetical protein